MPFPNAILPWPALLAVADDARTMQDLLRHIGPMLIPLFACSVFLLALTISRTLALRHRRVFPPPVVAAFRTLQAGRVLMVEEVSRLVRAYPGLLSQLLVVAVEMAGRPAAEIGKLLESTAGNGLIRLKTPNLWWAYLARIGPLLGLAGSLLGLIHSFQVIGGEPGAPDRLAAGIAMALVATLGGVVIAVAAETLAHAFRHWVERIAVELHELLSPLPDRLAARPALAPTTGARRAGPRRRGQHAVVGAAPHRRRDGPGPGPGRRRRGRGHRRHRPPDEVGRPRDPGRRRRPAVAAGAAEHRPGDLARAHPQGRTDRDHEHEHDRNQHRYEPDRHRHRYGVPPMNLSHALHEEVHEGANWLVLGDMLISILFATILGTTLRADEAGPIVLPYLANHKPVIRKQPRDVTVTIVKGGPYLIEDEDVVKVARDQLVEALAGLKKKNEAWDVTVYVRADGSSTLDEVFPITSACRAVKLPHQFLSRTTPDRPDAKGGSR